MKTVIIDIDSTLYDFTEPLYQEILRAGIACPPPYKWFEWNTPQKAVNNDKLFYMLVDNVHSKLLDFDPFPLARELMEWLKQRYFVMVATHRNKKYVEVTKDWLVLKGLVHDHLHVSYDKTALFSSNQYIDFIFDDCPATIGKANAAGIWTFSLWYPYNIGSASRNFDNIGHFLGYLMQKERSES